MIKLQPGDYVSTEGMTEEQYHAVCKAFMEAGANKCEYKSRLIDSYAEHGYIGWGNGESTSRHDSNGIFHFSDEDGANYFHRNRLLTIDQILGNDNTEGAKEMTKITVFGEQESKTEKKPIEFAVVFDTYGNKFARRLPTSYKEVMLMQKDYCDKMDLIIAVEDSGFKIAYLGHWNDGVV